MDVRADAVEDVMEDVMEEAAAGTNENLPHSGDGFTVKNEVGPNYTQQQIG